MKSYNPTDWYWLDAVGERVYASARQAVVTPQDAGYLAFIADGTEATQWPRDATGAVSDSELEQVLRPYGLALTLDEAKARLASKVDADAEVLRLFLITPGSGQAMEYQEAYAQATAALASPSNASEALYPMLAATVGIDVDPLSRKPATDVLGVARSVQAAFGSYLNAGAEIRGIRLKGKSAINAATSLSDAQAAYAAIVWPVLN